MVVVVEEAAEEGEVEVEEEEEEVEEDGGGGGGQNVKESKAEEKGDLAGERQSGDGQVRGHDLVWQSLPAIYILRVSFYC